MVQEHNTPKSKVNDLRKLRKMRDEREDDVYEEKKNNRLPIITIVLAVPTMISSFWGMNVSLPFEHSSYGFAIMIMVALITTLIVTWWLKKKDMFN